MVQVDQIKERLVGVIRESESYSDFADWLNNESASFRFSDSQLIELADSILNSLQVYFDHLISERELIKELRTILVSGDTQEREVQFAFDDRPADKATETSRSFSSPVQFRDAAFV